MYDSASPDVKTDPARVDLMFRVHQRFVANLDLGRFAASPADEIRRAVTRFAEHACEAECAAEGIVLQAWERDWLVGAVLDETFGFGPIEPLLREPATETILIKGPRDVWVERAGRAAETTVVFRDDAHLQQILDVRMEKVRRADPGCVTETRGNGLQARAIRIDVRRLRELVAGWERE